MSGVRFYYWRKSVNSSNPPVQAWEISQRADLEVQAHFVFTDFSGVLHYGLNLDGVHVPAASRTVTLHVGQPNHCATCFKADKVFHPDQVDLWWGREVTDDRRQVEPAYDLMDITSISGEKS